MSVAANPTGATSVEMIGVVSLKVVHAETLLVVSHEVLHAEMVLVDGLTGRLIERLVEEAIDLIFFTIFIEKVIETASRSVFITIAFQIFPNMIMQLIEILPSPIFEITSNTATKLSVLDVIKLVETDCYVNIFVQCFRRGRFGIETDVDAISMKNGVGEIDVSEIFGHSRLEIDEIMIGHGCLGCMLLHAGAG